MFRFTIRDMLWLTVVVGMALAWWTEHQRQNAFLDAMQKLQTENDGLRGAFRVTGYELQETNIGGFLVSRKPDDGSPDTPP